MIRTERLFLRRFEERDVEPFAAMNADPAVMRYFPSTLTAEETRAMLGRNEEHFRQHGFGFFAAELIETGEFTGFIGLLHPRLDAHFTPCVEVGWRLAERFWNRGFATEGARAMMEYGFTRLGQNEIVSFTAEVNAPSRRVMEKLGMTHNPADDFDHPRIAREHPLCRHVLYRLRCPPGE